MYLEQAQNEAKVPMKFIINNIEISVNTTIIM